MNRACFHVVPLALATAVATATMPISRASDEQQAGSQTTGAEQGIDKIETIVVIYDENRGFDHLFPNFPGANGIAQATETSLKQLDRDGRVLPHLPPVWGGYPKNPDMPGFWTQIPNAPFDITSHPNANRHQASPVGLDAIIPSPVHEFWKNKMQINEGSNNMFAAWSSEGGMPLGHYSIPLPIKPYPTPAGTDSALGHYDPTNDPSINDREQLYLWQLANEYALADNFYMAAFGGSFLNHQWLACACTPMLPSLEQDQDGLVAKLEGNEADGPLLTKGAFPNPSSALDGPPDYVASTITPRNMKVDGVARKGHFWAVNTMQPAYQPSAGHADPERPGHVLGGGSVVPPQTKTTLGDLLTEKGISWVWYAGGWDMALNDPSGIYDPATNNFQSHHQPYNYFENYAWCTEARHAHLQDLDHGRTHPPGHDQECMPDDDDSDSFWARARAGSLPSVVFIKPAGRYDDHPGYASVIKSDNELRKFVDALMKSPQWDQMVVIATFDENGGFWDHMPPPKSDYWGPGNRIPAVLISPFAKRGFVDSTRYDTTSIQSFIAKRHGLDLSQLESDQDTDFPQGPRTQLMGDLTNLLNL